MSVYQQDKRFTVWLTNDSDGIISIIKPTNWTHALAIWQLLLICPRIETKRGTKTIESLYITRLRR